MAFGMTPMAASAVSVSAIAVEAGGLKSQVGLYVGDKIKYYNPLNSSNAGQTYGVGNSFSCAHGGTAAGGECADKGFGTNYDDADGLFMNLFFDLNGKPETGAAELKFVFDDLDLTPEQDPSNFFESFSLAYWDGSSYQDVGGSETVIKDQGQLDTGAYLNAATYSATGTDPVIEWNLDLAALGILNVLKQTQTDDDGFWVQLGFGTLYKSYHKGKNTAELLTAELHVSPVPVPSAVWLFGSALIGFIGMSRRTRV